MRGLFGGGRRAYPRAGHAQRLRLQPGGGHTCAASRPARLDQKRNGRPGTSAAGHGAVISGTTRGAGQRITKVSPTMAHEFPLRAKMRQPPRTGLSCAPGGGIDVCVNTGVAPDRRLGDTADEDMNQVADIKFKDCKLTAHACKPRQARPGRGWAMRTAAVIGQAIVPGRGWLPRECTVAQDAD